VSKCHPNRLQHVPENHGTWSEMTTLASQLSSWCGTVPQQPLNVQHCQTHPSLQAIQITYLTTIYTAAQLHLEIKTETTSSPPQSLVFLQRQIRPSRQQSLRSYNLGYNQLPPQLQLVYQFVILYQPPRPTLHIYTLTIQTAWLRLHTDDRPISNFYTYQPLYNYLRQLDFASDFYIPRDYLLISLSFYTILTF
jgi:hypothetical protein